MAFVAFTGRLLFALLFIVAGVQKIQSFDPLTGGPMAAYMAPKLEAAMDIVQQHTGVQAKAYLPREYFPYVLLGAAVAEGLGGVLFVLDFTLGAVMMLLFLVPTTAIMHDFWTLKAGSHDQQIEMIMFMKV